ncbi:hypothetical protein [Pedobacter sp. UBA5917]|jgi:hypothetical protein|uniref:hypothetical protein n=1 Tax=Pedobacter sp. UBA5917 TaxID=1947061 RepID=UPI0025F65D40|nr:hypothetical protein [Pedobacter sp. UBA5917]
MEKDKIEALLEKYWNAETTLEEERVVKQYLESNDPEEKLMPEKEWFGAVSDFKSLEGKTVGFSAAIDKPLIKRMPLAVVLKIAASILLVIAASFWLVSYRSALAERDLALQKKVEADLFSISKTLNQANTGLNEIIKFKSDVKTQND